MSFVFRKKNWLLKSTAYAGKLYFLLHLHILGMLQSKKNCIVKLYDKCLDDKGIRYNRSYISDWPFGTDRADLPRTIALLDPVKPLRNHTDLPSMPPEVKPI